MTTAPKSPKKPKPSDKSKAPKNPRPKPTREQEIEEQRYLNEMWKLLSDLKDEAIVPAWKAAIFLGISEKKLSRLRHSQRGPDYIQVIAKDGTKARNQDPEYVMGELRRYRASLIVSSTSDAKKMREITFATIQSLLEEQPYWIQTIHSTARGGMGRGTVSKSSNVIIGHTQTVSDKKFKKLLTNKDARVRWISLDEAMSLPWADEEARQPFHYAYVAVLKQSIKKSGAQQERAAVFNAT